MKEFFFGGRSRGIYSAGIILIFILLVIYAKAGDSGKMVILEENLTEPEKQKKICDYLKFPKIYDNKNNPIIQNLEISGRYYRQWYYVDADEQGTAKDWDTRSFRLNASAKLFNRFQAFIKTNVNNDSEFRGRFIKDIDRLGITWDINEKNSLSAGKLRIRYANENDDSLAKIKTISRSLLVNQIRHGKNGGIQYKSKFGKNRFILGGFSGSVDDDYELPNFDGGFGSYLSFARDITDFTEAKIDYFYNDVDENNNNFKNYEHIFSFNTRTEFERWGLDTDVIYAKGLSNTSDVFGVVILPHYDIIPNKLQLVFRYHYANSQESNGLELSRRYERQADQLIDGTGDSYHSFYAGLNIFICGNDLKLVNGIQYSKLTGGIEDYEGLSFVSGIRFHF